MKIKMKIYNIPLNFLFKISNPQVKKEFELQDKTPVSYIEFKQDIKQNGIIEPLIIITHKDWIRLETGNHRIYALADLSKTSAPCVIKQYDGRNINIGNGKHFIK